MRLVRFSILTVVSAVLLSCSTVPEYGFDTPRGWVNCTSLYGGEYTVKGGSEGGRTVTLQSDGTDARAVLEAAIRDYDIIILDGSKGPFIVSSHITFKELKHKTLAGINGAVIRTKFEITPEMKEYLLENIPKIDGKASDYTLSNGRQVNVPTSFAPRQAMLDYTGDADENYMNAGLFRFWDGCEDFIIRNIAFVGPGAINIFGTHLVEFAYGANHFWIDHCSFTDAQRTAMYMGNKSDFFTVSWCSFDYTERSVSHAFSNLIGGQDDAEKYGIDAMNTTFAFCRWGQGVQSRTPMVRFANVHVVNCLHDCPLAGIDPRTDAEMRVEGCYFTRGVPLVTPHYSPERILPARAAEFVDNYSESGFETASKGSAVMPYTLPMIDARKVKRTVLKGAGPVLKDPLRIVREPKPETIKVDVSEAPFQMEPLEMFKFPDREFCITRYGARQGDADATTAAFAKAMEACNASGGGSVTVPAGEWLTGPVHFLSNCRLYLDEGARLVFDDDPARCLPAVQTSWEGSECMNYSPLLYAFGCSNIAIAGPGTLAPKTEFWSLWYDVDDTHVPHKEALRRLYAMNATGVDVRDRNMARFDANLRPQLIHFNRCRNVTLDGFEVLDSPFWTIHLFMCTEVWAKELRVCAHAYNNDGIDIEMSRRVVVENCSFDQGDDAVVIKAGRNQDGWRLAMPTSDVIIRNCNIKNGHSVLGIGSEISAGVERIYMHDCEAGDCFRVLYIKTNHRRGGFVRDITMERVNAHSSDSVVEIDSDVMYQWRDIVPTFETRITDISSINVRDVTCAQAKAVFTVNSDPRLPVRDVTISDVTAGGQCHPLIRY